MNKTKPSITVKRASFIIALIATAAVLAGGYELFRLMIGYDYSKKEWLVISIAYAFLGVFALILRIFIKFEDLSSKPHELSTILGVAVASIVQVAVASGEFTFWNVVIGSVLMFILLTHRITSSTSQKELLALSTTWGFTLTLTAGLGLQEIYKQLQWRNSKMPPLKNEEAPSILFFLFWILVSVWAYAYVNHRKSKQKPVDGSLQSKLLIEHDPLK